MLVLLIESDTIVTFTSLTLTITFSLLQNSSAKLCLQSTFIYSKVFFDKCLFPNNNCMQ